MDIFQSGYTISLDGISITALGSPTLQTGPRGTYPLLERSDQKIQFTNQPDHPNTCIGNITRCESGFTFSFWMNLKKDYYHTFSDIINAGGQAGSNSFGFLIFVNNNINKLAFGVKPANSSNRWFIFDVVPVLDEDRDNWVHHTMTWSESKGLYVYRNGQLFTHQRNKTVHIGVSSLNVFSTISIGQTFNGTLDDIVFYNTELNENQVYLLYSGIIF